MLYHYTCSHSIEGINEQRVLLPGDQLPMAQLNMPWTTQFVWLTDMAVPDRASLGLTSNFIRCDRLRYCYLVTETAEVHPWSVVARDFPELRGQIEQAQGARPAHWFVSRTPVPVHMPAVHRIPESVMDR